MNKKYFKLRLLQSIFLLCFMVGMSEVTYAQSGSGSGSAGDSGSTSASDSGGQSCPCPCFNNSGGGSDSGGSSGSGSNSWSGSGSNSGSGSDSSNNNNGDPCNCCTPAEVCPTPSINAPSSPQISVNGNYCVNAPVTFSTPDLGFPCIEYVWNFGANASPQTFVGRGPVDVTFFSAGNRQISLTIDNNCDRSSNPNASGSGSSGSDNSGAGSDSDGSASNSNDGSDSGSTSNGSEGTDSSDGRMVINGGVICPSMPAGMGGSGSGSSGSDDSGSVGSDSGGSGSNSNDGTDSGSTSNGSAGTDSSQDGSDNFSNCVPCRNTVSININVENCNQPAMGMIGDMVFNDLNGNGVMDSGEPGIQGIIVTLSKDNGDFVDQQTSDFFGKYKFNVIPNMSYKLTYTNIPSGFNFTDQNQGGNEANDSDANPNTGMTDPIFINPGDMRLDQDVGLVQGNANQGSVGDRVFSDNNGNGIQENGEPGIGGVTVKLQGFNGNILQETTTDGNGNYLFNGVSQGLYKVMFNTPTGFAITVPKQGGNESTDSDVQNNQMTNPFFLGEGQSRTDIDAGYRPTQPPSNNTASVGDRVFSDNNNNGQQDSGEPGIGGVTVKLQDANGNTLQETTTNSNGNYGFTNLASDTYKVMFNTPAGFNQSPTDVGNDATDSDNQSNQMTNTFFLAEGENNLTIDAGFVPQGPPPSNRAKVGDFVFRDNNGNGIQDNGEPGIQGVFIGLYRGDDSFVAFQLSGQNGMYMFGDLNPGSYKLKFVGQPGDLVPSPQDQSSDDNIDSDINFLGFTPTFNLSAGETNLSIDAGFAPDGPPPAICTINASVSNIRCDGSTYSFDVTVNGTDVGDWGWDLPEAGIYTQPYGSTRRVSGISGTQTLAIVDHDVAGCETTITVNPPAGCDSGGSNGGTGTCADINFSGDNGQITITGLTAAIEITKIFDASWNLIYECAGNCTNTVQQSVGAGDYNVQVQFYTAQWGFICEKQERVTVGSGGNNGGGNNGGGNNGGGNNGDCANITVQAGNGQITVSGWSAPVAIVKIFNPNFSIAKDCTGDNCAGPITASGLGAGRYHIDIQLYTADWQSICNFTEDVTLGSSSLVTPNNANDFYRDLQLSVYPNPATDELFVTTQSFIGQQAVLQIQNQFGQIVERIRVDALTENTRIALDKLDSGMYYISAQVAGETVITKKIIIE